MNYIKKGFTLAEVLIVITIIGVVAVASSDLHEPAVGQIEVRGEVDIPLSVKRIGSAHLSIRATLEVTCMKEAGYACSKLPTRFR